MKADLIPYRPTVHRVDPAADDGKRLAPELELLARWMDSVFEIPGLGIRFGLDAIIGLIPGLGDTLTSLVSLFILAAGRRHGVPRSTMLRMAANIGIDYVLGSLPLVGDVFDVYWKANIRNVELLRQFVEASPNARRRSRRGDWLFLGLLILGLVLVLCASLVLSYFAIVGIWHLVHSS